MISIQVPLYLVYRCEAFAHKSLETHVEHYASRNQKIVDKILEDIKTGKIAECGVFLHAKKLGEKISPPDFTVYDRGSKTFDPDFMLDDVNLHVKSCRTNRYEPSWVFQNNGRIEGGHTDVVVFEDDDRNVAVLCEVDGRTVHIHGFVRMTDVIRKKLFRKPLKKELAKSKQVLYLSDLLDANVLQDLG